MISVLLILIKLPCINIVYCILHIILIAVFTLGLSEIRQKMQRCRKNVYDGLENVYYL